MGTNPFLPENIEQFVWNHTRETPLQKRLRDETAPMPQHNMQISADEGAFLAFLIQATGAKNVLEIGTFTGYSALAMAMALPKDGRLTACDMSRVWTDIGRRYWKEAGVLDKIELRLGNAVETVEILLREGRADHFDFAFIDADKVNYDKYYEACLKLVRVGGMIALDNMLWSGSVADPDDHEPDTENIRAMNKKLLTDKRVDISLVTIADGVTLARRKV